MMQAVYQAENIGHFGLGFDAYAHFTSPIRRYPDLLIHRAIRYLLRGKKQNRHLLKTADNKSLPRSAIYPYDNRTIEQLGDSCSSTERRADSASYDVVDWLKCEYMQSRVGDEFDGTVATVTGFGLFVELDGIYIEGLVHITALDNDYYHFDAVSHVLTGERTGKRYAMGDQVRVQVAAVSLDDRKIDLVMVGSAQAGGKGSGGRKKSARGKRSGAAGGSKTGRDSGSKSRRSASEKKKTANKPAKTGRKGSRKKAAGDKSASATPSRKKARGGRSKGSAAKGQGAARSGKPRSGR